MVNTLDIHPCFIFVNFRLSNVHMEIGELCKRNNRKKRGELSFHHNNYGTLFQYSECIVILIWPVIQEHIKYAVIWREPCLRFFFI